MPKQNLWDKRVKNIIENSDLNQRKLAKMLLVREATVSDWKNGKHTPDPRAQRDLRQIERRLIRQDKM